MLKNLKRAAAIVLSFAMAIQFGLANSYYVNAEEEPVEPQQEQTTTVENNSEVQEEDANEVAVPETKSVELSYVAEDGTILQAATYRDFDLNYGLNTDSSVMLNFDGYTLKDVIVNNSQAVSADQASLSVTSDLVSVQFVYKKIIVETENQTTEPCKTEEKNEDDAEADPNPETEVKEELPEYPAFDQSEMAGDVVVHATAAEGVLPRDSKLVVKRITRKAILNAVEETVSEKNMEVESAVALDVTIQSKDGVEIQPNGSVNISFENVAASAQETNVYHVTNDASTVTEVATNAQSFDADHFSIYVITNENKVPLTTFNFVANGTTVSTQIVKSGDTLIAPTAPDMIGQAFVGWVDEAGNSFTGFGKQAEITETTTRTITARYEAALYVYFLNPDGSQIMRTEKVGDHKAHNFTAVSYEVDSTHKLVGWAAEANGTTNIADKISVPADQTSVNVYAIIKEGYWVSFNSDGGSIVDSQFVLHGDKLVLGKDTTPTKPGYSFDGWYNGLTKVENGATVTSPMNLTAHWKAAKVSYTVIHWWENADDDEYAFHESQELQGLTGATTTAAAKSYTVDGKNIFGESVNDKVFTATTIEQKTIKGDGSTIVNVYYKRKTYTMHFKERQNSRTDLSTITKKWGQSISKEEWPTYKENGNWQIKASYYGNSQYLAYTSTMPMKDSTLWSTSGYYTYKAYYYVRNIEDTGYELHHTDTIKMDSNPTIGKEDCYAIAGFKYDHGDPGVGGRYKDAKFYYTRNSYKIKFINNGKEDKSVDKKYQQSISNENYTPARPSSLPDYYEFDGWYENELCEGEAFDFSGKKMPAQNVTLYAKWTAKKISLTYNLNNPEGTVDKGTKKVAAGTIASTVLPSASAIEGYSFAGWYVADENGHMTNVAFNANDAILKDTNVIGKWLYNGELKVKYVADGVEAPKDNNVYAGGAKATVANGVTKEGKKFLGWQLDGNVYQPGQNFEVNKDLADDKNVITLTAVFGDSETSAILTYHPGNGNGEDQSVAILNNKEVTLENTSDLSYTAPGEDYYFAGWATSMEDAQKGNAKYAVGDKVRVNADSSNDLYATWVKKTVIEVTANSNTLQYNGEEQKVEGLKVVTAGYEVPDLKAEAKGTNFGTYDTVITGTATVTKGGVDVTDKVIVNVTKGTLTISKRDVTLTSGSASKVYDKTALTNDTVTVSGEGFAKNEGATYKVTGSRTKVGTSKNTFTYELKSNTTASNYNIEVKFGDLIVTAEDGEVVVTITGRSDSVEYDGNEKSVSGYEVTITEGSKYTTDDFTFNGTAEAKGTEAGTYLMGLNADQFTNTNDNYTQVTFIVNDGTLTITPKSINPDDEKNGITVTDPENSIYDGNEHINGLTVTDSKLNTTLVENTDYTLTYSGDLISVGTVTITIKGIGNYTGEFTKTYQILPREYTVTTNTDSKVYDGNPLTAGGTVNNLVKDETVNLTMTGSQTDVGTSDNTYELNWTGSAKESNYTHGKDSIGTLTVKAKSIVPDGPNTPEEKKTGITVTDPKDSKYDGEEHKNKPKVEDTKTKATLKEGRDYELSYSEDVTNAGTVTVTVTGIGNYEGSFEVTYEITKRHVTLTSADDEKVYDGSALTNDTVTVGGDKFAKKEGATYNVTGMQIEKGSSKNTFTYTLNEGTLAGNYDIETFEGTLKVTAFENEVVVTIKGNKGTVTYDGNPHSVEGYVITDISNKLYKADYIGVKGYARAEGTAAGTYKMNLTAQQFSNTSASFDKVTFKVEDGALTINPKSITPDGPDTPDEKKTGITVTKPSDSKYDGEEHKNKPTVTDTKTNRTLVEGTDYTLAYSEDVINAGTVTVTVTGIGNYEGSFEVTYEITKRNVTLTSGSASKVYDKTALTKDEVTVSGDGFAKDEGATYKVTGSRTKVGTSKNTFTYELKSNTTATNYNIEVKFGELKVTAQDGEVVVTITGRSDSVEYDGNEKSVSGYDVTITEGSKYTTDDFTFNGTAEAKGTEAGTYSMGLNADQFTNTNDNYKNVRFVVNDGSLTISPKSITPDGPDTPEDEKTGITVTDPIDSTYDGNEHINGLTVTDSKLNTTLVEGTDYTLTYSGDLINVGTVTITIKGVGNYTGEFTKTYQILPREYTVTTNTDSKVYDGTALTAGGTVNNLVDGETVNLTMTGSQTDVGTSDNTYELNWTGSAKESNYTHGKDSIGTLTVTKQSIAPDPEHPETYKEVTITSPSDEVYDGKEHKWIPTVTDKEENELVAKTDYKVTYSTTDFTNVTGTITVTITGIGNYTGKATRTYSITPKTYTVTTESDSKVYDGTALTAGGKVSGIVRGETVEFTITGSQTSVGTSDNTYELNWTGSAKESNYKHGKDSIGTLTVKAKSIVPDGPDTPDEKKTGITVSDPSDSKYDGKEHREVLTVQDTKTDKKLVAEKDYSVTYSDDLVNAGTVTITIEGIGNYTGSFTKTYEITKRSVTLTSATASKTYDGQALTSTSITVSGDGFVKGEGATYNVTGTQTEVGNSANSFEYKLNENTLASNYDITKVVGTLTVTRDTTPVTPAPTPTTPSVPPVVQRVVPTPTPVPEEKVEEEQTPKAEPKEEEKVEEDYTPKATQEYYWALINLICAIVTVLFGLLLLISKRHKDEDDEEEDDETKQQATTNEDEEQEQEKKRGLFTRVLAVLIAIVSVVFFLVTEDMSLAWTWTDQWTIWMVVIGLVQIVVFFVGRKWKNVDNDDDDEEAQQA
ncbi:InlB B-repeat-containing protein [Holdemanella biformis]|uniref:InlB B-repeat-containing protein n=2 Tax=Holdemanella biformis TaxID=1735 RepID=UPI0022E72F90|nr:InlB B-repeat-containing protein [Holdemanella biformis]